MACKYYCECEYCANYIPQNEPEKMCEIYGLPIGSGDAYCKGFSCNVDECKRSECISHEELLEGF